MGGRETAGSSRPMASEEARQLVGRLNRDAVRIAGRFGLVYRAILAERTSVTGHYGVCYEDGLIKIRLQHATRGTPLKYSSLIHTLCHELAHLRNFDHGEKFQRFLAEVLAWARREGIYRPRARSWGGEPQPEECGVAPEERRRFLQEMRRAAARSRRRAAPEQLSLFGA